MARAEGLITIARQVHELACRFAAAVESAGNRIEGGKFFDCVTVSVPGQAEDIAALAEKGGRLVRVIDADRVSVTFVDEAHRTGRIRTGRIVRCVIAGFRA